MAQRELQDLSVSISGKFLETVVECNILLIRAGGDQSVAVLGKRRLRCGRRAHVTGRDPSKAGLPMSAK